MLSRYIQTRIGLGPPPLSLESLALSLPLWQSHHLSLESALSLSPSLWSPGPGLCGAWSRSRQLGAAAANLEPQPRTWSRRRNVWAGVLVQIAGAVHAKAPVPTRAAVRREPRRSYAHAHTRRRCRRRKGVRLPGAHPRTRARGYRPSLPRGRDGRRRPARDGGGRRHGKARRRARPRAAAAARGPPGPRPCGSAPRPCGL